MAMEDDVECITAVYNRWGEEDGRGNTPMTVLGHAADTPDTYIGRE